MADLPFRDLAKLQEQRFNAFETKQDVIDRILLRNFKAAYEETVGQMAKLYAKVGQENAKDGYYIHKEDAIRYNQFNNRLENLKAEIETLRKKGVKLTEENSAQSVQDAYYGGQWAFEQAVSVPLPIPALLIAAIWAAVYSDVSGLDLVKTWAKNSTDMYYKTQSAMMRGLTQGYSYTKMARSIKDEFDKGLWQAQRVVRTEAGRCWSEGAEEAHGAALEAGLDVRKRWSAALDSRTRTSHARLDGQYADEEGYFNSGGDMALQPRTFGIAAQDINCRCAVYDVLDGIEPSVRRIRGETAEDGYSSQNAQSRIVPYQTFEQWAAPRGWSPERGWPKGAK
jgi:SPP1 gp7 family putative phage head morphogenesis protein